MKNFTKLIALMMVSGLFFISCKDQPKEEMKKEPITEDVKIAEVKSVVFNANLATEEELSSTGLSAEVVSQVLAQRPFLTMNDLDKLILGDNKEEIYKKVFVPFNLNTTAEDDFKMIPGVGDKMAHEFEEYRPYKNMAQFRKEIGKYVDDKELARLERFVYLKE